MADMITNGMHGCSAAETYVAPADPLLKERLEWFQDQKLALMMHFGLYSQMGIIESWPLVEEDKDWARYQVDWVQDSETFRSQYVNLNRSFNPVCLQPDQWADIAARDGFRYLIFTTKHHDGFCMFDTKQTDYKVTSPDCPFHTHKYANIARHVFDAFRARGLAIAAYFSKPDWHCPWYWAEGMDRPVAATRNPTYTPAEHPEVWEKYVEFTQKQIMELISDYGRIDILWLDGGQVNPANGQDIRLSEVLAEARKIQPWLLSADRTVGGENENYITPEQSLPSAVIPVPWESCITVGTGFSYQYDDKYKSSRELVRLLVSVVARGGNLALNLAPGPDGRLPKEGVKSLDGLGRWLQANGDAIYGTRVCAPYEAEGFFFTQKAAQGKVYAIRLLEEGEGLPETLTVPYTGDFAKVTLLDCGEVSFTRVEGGVQVRLPHAVVGANPEALSFRFEK